MGRLITLLFFIAIGLFSAHNSADITLSWWPLPYVSNIPLPFIVVMMFSFGLLVGYIWASLRKRNRSNI